ncbi:MAG: hypothetical protein GX242_01330 [Clostridiales bacterium]|nr:hypothetical protein [Clostridiales bacterium]
MKKLLAVFALALVCIFVFTSCNPSEVEEDLQPLPAVTISISNAEELADINNYLGAKYINYTFSLEKDIDISTFTQWQPIGNIDQPFMATFLGNGKTISNLTYIGMDTEGKPTVANLTNNVALFGVTKNAKIVDLNLTDIELNLYTYGDYFHTAGLVAYNIGDSEFSDITITGNINLSNIYYYNTTYGMDGKVQDDKVITCNTTQYIGGLVAYSSGKTFISNIDVDIDISNKNYKAIYEVEKEEVDGEAIVVDEGYYVHSYSTPLPKQTMAGFLGGYIRNGAVISDVIVSGDMEVFAKSVYGAPSIAILIGSKALEITSNTSNLTLIGSEKVAGAGSIALLDSSKASNITVDLFNINAEPIGGSVKNISIGGIVSYCNDRAELTDSKVKFFNAKTTIKDKIELGGIAGVVRDAKITKNEAKGVFTIDESRVNKQSYLGCGSIVYGAYGNAVIKQNKAEIEITLKDGDTSLVAFDIEYGTAVDTPYVNEDGKPVGRFASSKNVKDYVEVFVAKEKANEITAYYHDSEGRELGKVVFSIDDNLYTQDGPNWSKYMSVYYVEKSGLINASGTVLELGGKSFAGYKQVTGVPEISDNIVL